MNDRTREFLDRWKAEHIEIAPHAQWEKDGKQLAFMCWEDAVRIGISTHDLGMAAGGDLIQNMIEALKAAAGPRD